MIRPEKTYCPNILTVSGTGRKVGKTTLACSIIKMMRGKGKVTGVKISPHFHDVDYENSIAEKSGAYAVYQEDRMDRGKDSSQMLAAGADKVYYVQTNDQNLRDAWEQLSELLDKDAPVIIESGRIHELVRPGLSLLLIHPEKYNEEMNPKKAESHPDFAEVILEEENFEPVISRISYVDGNWILKEKYD